MKQPYILYLLAVITTISCCNSYNSQKINVPIVVENNLPTESLSEQTKISLDSLSKLLVEEYKMYDLPHFNKGKHLYKMEHAAIYSLKKEKSVRFSFGIIFCTIGIDSINEESLKERDVEMISSNQSEFKHTLPCSFKDYIDSKIPSHELFENYYNKCLETNDIKYFWEFQYALLAEAEYLLSWAPENFLQGADDEQYISFVRKCEICRNAIYILSKEDSFYTSILEFRQAQADRYGLECNKSFSTVSEAISGYPKYLDYFRNIRHQLLIL